jgi:uncharacterized protein YjdB
MGKKIFTLLACLSLVMSMLGVVSCAGTTDAASGTTTVAVTGVTLSESTASVVIGSTLTLTATVAPDNATDKSVTWASSDDSKATVNDGVVTGIAAGDVVITATSVSDTTKSASCTVTVSENVIAVTGITLSSSAETISVTGSVTLTAAIEPANATNKAYTWKSSDEKIATVKDGKVTGIAAGSADITVTSTADSTKTATCKVTVENVAVTSVDLTAASATVDTGSTLQLVVTLTPANATITDGSIVSSDTAVATVDEATLLVTGKKAGTATITVSVTDYAGKIVTKDFAIEVKDVAPTALALSKSSVGLLAGGTETLTATFTPSNTTNQEVTWSTDDDKVATVANGVVTAVGIGSTTITATSKADTKVVATCTVSVNPLVITMQTGVGGAWIHLKAAWSDSAYALTKASLDVATNKPVISGGNSYALTIDGECSSGTGYYVWGLGFSSANFTGAGTYTCTFDLTIGSDVYTVVTTFEGKNSTANAEFTIVSSTFTKKVI